MTDFVNTVDVIGDNALTDSIIERTITEYHDNNVTKIGDYAFERAAALTNVKLPSVTNVGQEAFFVCSKLHTADFSALTSISMKAFYLCSALTALIIRSETMCTAGTNALQSSAIVNKKGYVYVPAALIDSYKAATYWNSYPDQFRALEDYTVDGTITGELDATKI